MGNKLSRKDPEYYFPKEAHELAEEAVRQGWTIEQWYATAKQKFPDVPKGEKSWKALLYGAKKRLMRLTEKAEKESISFEIMSIAEKVEALENENKKLREDNIKLSQLLNSLRKVREAVEEWQDEYLKS